MSDSKWGGEGEIVTAVVAAGSGAAGGAAAAIAAADRVMREQGIGDPRDRALRYAARSGCLYRAGNCVASPAGRARWGPDATIGLAIVFGGIAARHSMHGHGREEP